MEERDSSGSGNGGDGDGRSNFFFFCVCVCVCVFPRLESKQEEERNSGGDMSVDARANRSPQQQVYHKLVTSLFCSPVSHAWLVQCHEVDLAR